MFPKPQVALSPNTYEYESFPLVKPTGFREYDARWLFEKEINLMGVQALGRRASGGAGQGSLTENARQTCQQGVAGHSCGRLDAPPRECSPVKVRAWRFGQNSHRRRVTKLRQGAVQLIPRQQAR